MAEALIGIVAIPGICKDIAASIFKSMAKPNELRYKNKLLIN
jgi:hypothetical protein